MKLNKVEEKNNFKDFGAKFVDKCMKKRDLVS